MNTIRYELSPSGVAMVTINRPEVRNALNIEAIDELAAVFAAISNDPQVRVVILTGEGDKAFIAGGDLKEIHDLGDYVNVYPVFEKMRRVLDTISHLPVPVIASINGIAVGGGCETALACDMRIASDTAKLGFVQVKLAITSGWGGGPRLVRQVGYSQALRLLATGDVVSAQEALAMGLVDQVVPAACLRSETMALAERIAQNPTLAVQSLKKLARATEGALQRAIETEGELLSRLWDSEDHHEAVNAFFEKREPIFRGK